MKQFKEGETVCIVGKVKNIRSEPANYPIRVVFGKTEIGFTLEGNDLISSEMPILQPLSDIQQSQFTNEELQEIKECVFFSHEYNVDMNKRTLRGDIIIKVNNLLQLDEEKEFIELAKKLGYKIEKI